MTNEYAKAELASVWEEVQRQFRSIAQIQQARAELTASATVRKRVTVTVNADGTIIDTKFGPGIEELTFPEIAKAVTAAAQQACAEVGRKAQELMAPLQERRARLPKVSDLIEGMPDFRGDQPVEPEVPLAPPGSAQRQDAADNAGAAAAFSNVEAHTLNRRRGVTQASW
ncbi:YbaB/EbfC family nucleoid-associated protein [Nocardia sp. NPDC049149]|uniref:YbaB/EbfC family nucleoid-associated protein n=1 Tax=Nocardia sp. NPDC049149 TaxID=3364315 RepID=UPI0037137552